MAPHALTALGVGMALTCATLSMAGQSAFDGSPGIAPPPATLGPYLMHPVAQVACARGTVSSIPALSGSIGFFNPLAHYRVTPVMPSLCLDWGNPWHGYPGDVFYEDGTSVTMTLPAGTTAIYFYVSPAISVAPFNFTVTADDGASSGTVAILGDSGPNYFGFYSTSGTIGSLTITNIGDSSFGFAIGEFGIATADDLTCTGDVKQSGEVDGVDLGVLLGQWTGPVQYKPCPPLQSADLDGDCDVDGLDLGILLANWGDCGR